MFLKAAQEEKIKEMFSNSVCCGLMEIKGKLA